MNSTTAWWLTPPPEPNQQIQTYALDHQNQLTKPPGSLGQLEELAVSLAAIQHSEQPNADTVSITVFAGDHGITEEGVSAFPQSVTVEMQRNFIRGGAAISVLARHLDATLEVVNTGTQADPDQLPGVIHAPIAQQTANFCQQPAMSETQWETAMALGAQAVERAEKRNCRIFIGGEMGIGNTTAATAMFTAHTGLSVAEIIGPGTGLDRAGIEHKQTVIERAVTHHQADLKSAKDISRCLGGFEIVALTGAYIAAAQRQMAIIVDGFICSAAAAIALELNPKIAPYLLFSHCSAEPGHKKVLDHLALHPIMNLNLRLGEGSGAATVIPLLRMACALHNEMATFAQASVSGKLEP